MGKLEIYMVKKDGQYFRRAGGWLGSWTTDPKKASVWASYQGPAAVLTIHPTAEKITLEVELP